MPYMTYRQAWKATIPRLRYTKRVLSLLTFYTWAINSFGWGVELNWHRRTRSK